MLQLTCPHCHVTGEETEFAPGGQAHIERRGTEADDEAFEVYLFYRENPRGLHFERWRHAFGCGKWFHAARNTLTLEVYGTYPATATKPPQEILDRAKERGA